jgi:hypothetical protein
MAHQPKKATQRKRGSRSRTIVAVIVVGLLALGGVWVATRGPSSADARQVMLAPESMLTDPIAEAPANVREAYRFAIANPDVLMYVPCYCGCAAAGHTSNLDCFVNEFGADGSVTLDRHGFG